MKPTWKKPKLIVLVKGKPEERVLAICKEGFVHSGGGPISSYVNCVEVVAPECLICSSLAAS